MTGVQPHGDWSGIAYGYDSGHADPKVTDDPTPSTASDAPSVFIQWKGTDVCLDFYCVCGMQSHLDSDFVYALKCSFCGRIFDMPCHLPVKEQS